MTTLEYLAVLFSVVVGLAVTQTLRGLLRVVHHRRTMVICWSTLVWTAGVLQWAIFFWWFSGIDLVQLEEWRFSTLLFVLAYGSVLYFLLGLLHPDDAGSGFDMRAHFNENRTWFFGVFLGLGVLDAVDTVYKMLNDFTEIEEAGLVTAYLAFLVVWIVGAMALLRARNRVAEITIGVLYIFTLWIALRTPIIGVTLGAG